MYSAYEINLKFMIKYKQQTKQIYIILKNACIQKRALEKHSNLETYSKRLIYVFNLNFCIRQAKFAADALPASQIYVIVESGDRFQLRFGTA